MCQTSLLQQLLHQDSLCWQFHISLLILLVVLRVVRSLPIFYQDANRLYVIFYIYYSKRIDFEGVIFATKYDGPIIISKETSNVPKLRSIINIGFSSMGTAVR